MTATGHETRHGTGPAAMALVLSRIAASRLGPCALQCRLDAMQGPITPCGGLTRHQIDSVSFAWLTEPALRLRHWLGRIAAGRPSAG
jgi:hypothetical protein